MNKGILVTLKILPGKNADFEKAFAEQAANCKANEPGQKLYKLFRSQTDTQTYHIMEIYEDEAALNAHRNAAHMALTRDKVRATIDGGATITVVDAV
jgi:quinol monooxygenase YgiN